MTTLLQFSVEGISCAIKVGKTVFVERMVQVTPPSERGFGIAGVINLHGRKVPVYQVRILLGFPERKPRLSDVLIVTKAGSDCVALWVDETSGISQDTSLSLEDASTLEDEPAVPGVTITAEGLVIIRDLAGFFRNSNPEQIHAELHTRKGIPREDTGEDPGRITAILAERAQKLSQPAVQVPGDCPHRDTEIPACLPGICQLG